MGIDEVVFADHVGPGPDGIFYPHTTGDYCLEQAL